MKGFYIIGNTEDNADENGRVYVQRGIQKTAAVTRKMLCPTAC